MRNVIKKIRDSALWWTGRGHALPIAPSFRAAYMWGNRDGAAWANEHMPARWRLWQDSPAMPSKRERRLRRFFRLREDVIYFRTEDDLILFKLRWSAEIAQAESEAKLGRVILPLMRRVMPTIMANQIIGVQPMTGPVGQIHTLRARYAEPPLTRWQKLRISVRRLFLGEPKREALARELDREIERLRKRMR